MNEEQEKIYNEITFEYNFNEGQLYQIRSGLINGVDISSYLSSDFKEEQMKQIRLKMLKESTL